MNLISTTEVKILVQKDNEVEERTNSCRKNIISLQGLVVVSDKRSKWSFPRSPIEVTMN